MNTNTPSITIKHNNCASNDPCGICGQRTDPIVGPEFFLADSWALVCHQCAEKRAPELMALYHEATTHAGTQNATLRNGLKAATTGTTTSHFDER